MENQFICFFSSDARPQYKVDIYSTLALPSNYVIHFRYRKKYIDENISFDNIKNKAGIIFYSTSNDLALKPEDRKVGNYSIRKVKIIDFSYSEQTDLYHFYLQLLDFCDFKIDSNNAKEKLPANKFVSLLNVTGGTDKSWIGRIEEIKFSFQKTLFFTFDIYSKNKLLSPKYSEIDKRSEYDLVAEEAYSIKISHTENIPQEIEDKSEKKLMISDRGNLVSINCPETFYVKTIRDDTYFTLITNSLSTSMSRTFLNLTSIVNIENEPKITNEINIDLKVRKGLFKFTQFGFFSVLAFISTIFIGHIIYTYNNCNKIIWWEALLSILFVFVSTSLLYNFFNKK